MKDLVGEVILILGGWTIVITSIMAWFSNLISKRIINSWEAKNQQTLEILRANQSENRVLLENVISSISSSQTLLQERRVNAVDKMWKCITELRDYFSPAVFFFSIIYPDEYSSALTNSTIEAGVLKITEQYIANYPTDLENSRPYLGETLWLQFFIYRALLSRLAILVNWLKEGKEIPDWREDNGIQQHVKTILNDDEYRFLMSASPTNVQFVLNAIESKMLEEMSYILSGRKSSVESFKSSSELRKMLAQEKLQAPDPA